MSERFKNFNEFYTFYLGQHLRSETKRFHFMGTLGGLIFCIFGLYLRAWGFVLEGVLWAYGLAWYSHFVYEKNRPATFRHPIMSLRADFKMSYELLAGRFKRESVVRQKTFLK